MHSRLDLDLLPGIADLDHRLQVVDELPPTGRVIIRGTILSKPGMDQGNTGATL